MKRTPRQPYYSYLIRLWQGNEEKWHATLQDVHTGDRQAFGQLEDLFAFLTQHIAQQSAAPSLVALPEESAPTDSD